MEGGVTLKSNRGNVFCTIAQTNRWDIEEFEEHQKFVALSGEDKPRLRQCYEAANPLSFGSLLAAHPVPPGAIEMDGLRFVSDKAAIFAGLVEILYSMRNISCAA